MSDLSVFFVGTAGSTPTSRRGLPSLLVQRGGERLLFDCGEGTQRQLVSSVGLPDLDAVFITHFHADHWLGLPGMLKTFDLRGRETPMTVYGPPGLRSLMEKMRVVYGTLRYEVEFTELQAGDSIKRGNYAIVPFAVEHAAKAHGYALVEEERPGEFDAPLAKKLGVESGPDFGRLQRGETVNGVLPEQVIGPARAGRKLVVSGDTRPCETVQIAATGADLLVHEATFIETEAQRAAETNHSTARQAAEIARAAEVKFLALVHITGRYLAKEIRSEAQAVFKNAFLAHDFDTIEIPFPDRGAPHWVSWKERQPQLEAEAD